MVGGGPEASLKQKATNSASPISRPCRPGAQREVGSSYSLIDVLALSTPDDAITDLVRPLKPLEAMAQKPVRRIGTLADTRNWSSMV